MPNSKTLREGHDAVLQIELDGAFLPLGASGLTIEAGTSEVMGLAFHSFRGLPIPSYEQLGVTIEYEGGAGVELNKAGGNIIAGNFFGAAADGSPRGNFGAGIDIASSNNTVLENIMIGNMTGVEIGGVVTGNKLFANYIGVRQDGVTAVHNEQGVLIALGASETEIGGTQSNFGNVISATQKSGVMIVGLAPGNTVVGSNIIQNNLIGTDRTGKLIDPDGQPHTNDELGNWNFGVQVTASVNNVIAGNVISGNREGGVLIKDVRSNENQIVGNRIGTDVDGTQALGNRLNGVDIQDAVKNHVDTNVISGNWGCGVAIFGATAKDNWIKNNQIGIDNIGNSPLPNKFHGVQIDGGASNHVQGNVIAGNAFEGIYISGATASGNEVIGNRVGCDAIAGKAIPNGVDGIYIDNAPRNVIGGTTAAKRNIISGNTRCGVYIQGTGAEGNQIAGNYIGTKLAGQESLANGKDGLRIEDAPKNVIGGASAEDRNVISGNSGSGVVITGKSAVGNRVAGNFIGTNKDGSGNTLANKGDGVLIDGASAKRDRGHRGGQRQLAVAAW